MVLPRYFFPIYWRTSLGSNTFVYLLDQTRIIQVIVFFKVSYFNFIASVGANYWLLRWQWVKEVKYQFAIRIGSRLKAHLVWRVIWVVAKCTFVTESLYLIIVLKIIKLAETADRVRKKNIPVTKLVLLFRGLYGSPGRGVAMP